MFGVMQDITDRKEVQARQEVLTHELEHRIKNILTMIGAIASQTLKNTDLETARSTFGKRLIALSHAHDILTKTQWINASLQEVVEQAAAVLPKGARHDPPGFRSCAPTNGRKHWGCGPGDAELRAGSVAAG